MMEMLLPLIVAVVIAAGLMPLVMRRGALDKDHHLAPQNVHNEPTSRLGGAVVFVAFAAGIAAALAFGHPSRRLLLVMVLSALPVLLAGLYEDLTHRLRPRERLIAALLSAILASWLAGGTIARLDLPVVDGWLRIALFVLPLTWFMVAGACNAMNLIDGAHGLAAGTALLMFCGLAVAAAQLGDLLVLTQALALIGALAGFLLWNYPRGKVFLGDGGSYLAGFVYAQLSIQIVARNDGLSAWFVIMLGAYPITETLYSMYRRKIVHRTPSMQPDALHLHSLVLGHELRNRGLSIRAMAPHSVNARVAPRLWVHGALCLVVALTFRHNTPLLITGIAAYMTFYCWQYALLSRRAVAPPSRTVQITLEGQRDSH